VAGSCECGNEPSDWFHKMWEISLLAEKRSASQEGLCCMEVVTSIKGCDVSEVHTSSSGRVN